MGLVLSRRTNEATDVTINGVRITATVVEIRGDRVRIDWQAPPEATIHRREIQELVDAEAARKANGAGDTRGED